MTILNDKEIDRLARLGMIEPYAREQIKEYTPFTSAKPERAISAGLSSFGYDAVLGNEFEIFDVLNAGIIDPKRFDDSLVRHVRVADHLAITLPPGGFALCHTKEYFRIPRDVVVICLGKSTYARCGLVVNVTPLEPEWEGHVTIELSNTTPLPTKVYAGEGICQFLFLRGEPCGTSYADRAGKYMGQTGITQPKV